MDKKLHQGTTFTRNNKNFKENIWRAKKSGLQFSIFRKSLKWRVEAEDYKSNQVFNFEELGFIELEDAFDFVVKFKSDK